MYVCHAGKDDERIKDLRFPYDVEIGFDCEKRDFISPYGEGVVTDFYVRISSIPMPDDIAKQMKDCLRLKREAGDDRTKQFYISQEFNHILITYHEFVLSVPDKDGGFIRKKKKMNKVLVSEYEAPLDGYTNSIRMIRENERGLDEYNPSDVTDEDYLIFKTRIVRNDEGEIISANYGKIYGPVEHFIDRWLESCRIGFVCYFNPEPNNRSIEFDEMNNLFYPQYKSSIFKP